MLNTQKESLLFNKIIYIYYDSVEITTFFSFTIKQIVSSYFKNINVVMYLLKLFIIELKAMEYLGFRYFLY